MGLGPGENGYTHRGVAGDCVVMDCLEESVEAVLILVAFVLQQIPDNLREGGFLSFTALEDSAHCHKEARVSQSDSHHGGQETERKVVCVVGTSVFKPREWCRPHSR